MEVEFGSVMSPLCILVVFPTLRAWLASPQLRAEELFRSHGCRLAKDSPRELLQPLSVSSSHISMVPTRALFTFPAVQRFPDNLNSVGRGPEPQLEMSMQLWKRGSKVIFHGNCGVVGIRRGELKQANPCACAGAAPKASRAPKVSFTDTKIQYGVVAFSGALVSL